MYFIGLDVHKKTISYCVKDGSGQIHAEGAIPAIPFDLGPWMKTLPQPWTAAMEATLLTGRIYDRLPPHAAELFRMTGTRGAIAAGKAADIIATPENPLEDIKTLRHVHFVMKDGKIVKRPK